MKQKTTALPMHNGDWLQAAKRMDSYARHRSVARVQHSISQTLCEKLRELIQPYAVTLVQCVHALTGERTCATVPNTAVSSNSSGTHRTANTQRRTQQLKYTSARARHWERKTQAQSCQPKQNRTTQTSSSASRNSFVQQQDYNTQGRANAIIR